MPTRSPISARREPTAAGLTKDLPESSKPLRLEYRNPKELKANEKNWRTHPKRQRQAFQALKSKVGWAGAPLYNETTQRLVDGHMRVDEAIKAGETTIPVLIGSWTEEQENLLLAQLDPIGQLATTNKEALANLTKANSKKLTNLNDNITRTLAQFNQDLEGLIEDDLPEVIPTRKPVAPSLTLPSRKDKEQSIEDLDPSYEPPEDLVEQKKEVYVNSTRFPSSDNKLYQLPLQIPDLIPDLIATPDILPEQVFNRSKHQDTTNPKTYYCISSVPWPTDRQGGVLGFFSEDYRFNHCFAFPDKFIEELLEEDWSAVLSPDYSTFDDIPFPEKLWALHRSRWCARYWQEAGIYIIPSIQYMVINNYDYTYDMVIGTLPDPCPTIAFQVRSLKAYEELASMIDYAVEHKGTQGVLIYGGQEKKKYIHGHIQSDVQVAYLPSFITERRRVYKEEM